jgi:hypothetical protein
MTNGTMSAPKTKPMKIATTAKVPVAYYRDDNGYYHATAHGVLGKDGQALTLKNKDKGVLAEKLLKALQKGLKHQIETTLASKSGCTGTSSTGCSSS